MSEEQLTPRVQNKRETILKYSLKVFAREGFRNTDVQIIADLAKVGKGTVYRHFGNKEQLFLATARHCLDQLRVHIEEQLGGPEVIDSVVREEKAVSLIRRIARAYADFYQENPQAVEIMIQERAEFREGVYPSHLLFRAETRGGFEDFLRQAISRGELRNVDASEATNAFSDLLFGTVVNGCLEGGKKHLVARAEQAVNIFLDGLAVPGS